MEFPPTYLLINASVSFRDPLVSAFCVRHWRRYSCFAFQLLVAGNTGLIIAVNFFIFILSREACSSLGKFLVILVGWIVTRKHGKLNGSLICS